MIWYKKSQYKHFVLVDVHPYIEIFRTKNVSKVSTKMLLRCRYAFWEACSTLIAKYYLKINPIFNKFDVPLLEKLLRSHPEKHTHGNDLP